MSFNVTGIVNYTKTNENMLLANTIYNAKSASILGRIEGVTHSAFLPKLDQTIFFQSNACNATPSGTTTFSTRTLTVGNIAIVDSWCLDELKPKYTQLLSSDTMNQTEFPRVIEEVLVETYQKTIAAKNEDAIWKGDLSAGNVNLNKFDGLVKIINASSAVQANTTAFQAAVVTAVTASNILSIVNGIYNAIPEELLPAVDSGDVFLVMGAANFRAYQLALMTANLFHYAPNASAEGVQMHPGTSLKVMMLNGLSGVNAMYAANWRNNVFIGESLSTDSAQFKMYFDEKTDTLNAKVKYTLGVQIGIPSEIVKFTY